MKTKFLLPALALPLMVACTQDELVGQVETNVPQTEERIVVGPVTFVDGNQSVESRLNYFTGNWEDGDKFGLFRMDQRKKNQDYNWAAEENFMEQGVWNNMYEITNDYLTNFPFSFNESKKAWENDDKTVEGNYFAVVPAKNQKDHLDKLTSSNDVWMYINPVQKIVFEAGETKSNEGIEENQFFLGYTQIYRDQQANTADGKLQLPINMQPILANLDMEIVNGHGMEYRIEKMVISRAADKNGAVAPVPTLAYLRPAGNTPKDFSERQDDANKLYGYQGNITTEENIDRFVDRYENQGFNAADLKWAWSNNIATNYQDFGPAFAQPYLYSENNGVCKDETYHYWSLDSWTREAARSTVKYAYPGQYGYTPYGCEYEPAYEYVIEFDNANGDGYVELSKINSSIRAAFTLPHDLYLPEFNVVLYGQVKVGETWKECFIYPNYDDIFTQATDNIMGAFKLQNIDLTSNQDYLKSQLVIASYSPVTSRVVKTTNSADLLKHLKAYYGETPGSTTETKNTYFYVETMGEFVVTNELVDYVVALNAKYGANGGSRPVVYFVKTNGVNGIGQLTFPANLTNDHAIDLFYYSKQVTIFNEGTQIIEKPIIYDYDNTEEELMAAWRECGRQGWDIFADAFDLKDKIEPAIANTVFGGVGRIVNAGSLTIKTIVETLPYSGREGEVAPVWNMEDATLTLDGGDSWAEDVNPVIYGGIFGTELNTCIHNDGTLNMKNFEVEGTVDNQNVLVADGYSKIENLLNQPVADCYTCVAKVPTVTVNVGATLELDDYAKNFAGAVINVNGIIFGEFVENHGVININETGKGHFNNMPANEDPYDDHGKLYNYGTINVKGHLAQDIMNVHLINVIGDGRVVVNGDLNKDGVAGIIDVTKANAGEEGWAKDISTHTGRNYFRYDVQAETTATDLISALKQRISQNNWNNVNNVADNNRIIIRWTAETTATEFSGDTKDMNIERVIISKDLKIVNRTEAPIFNGANFPHLNDVYYGYDFYSATNVESPAFRVDVDATLTVANDATLTLAEDYYSWTGNNNVLMVLINGKIATGTASKLEGNVAYDGYGVFEFTGADANNSWVAGNFKGNY